MPRPVIAESREVHTFTLHNNSKLLFKLGGNQPALPVQATHCSTTPLFLFYQADGDGGEKECLLLLTIDTCSLVRIDTFAYTYWYVECLFLPWFHI